MTVNPEPANEPPRGITLEGVALVVGPGIGLAGGLIVIGYIADSARESLLGVELHPATSTADYTFKGAQFLIDVLDVVEKHFGFTIIVVAVVILCSLALGWILRRTRKLRLKHEWRHTVMKLIVSLILLVKWSAIDLPFTHFERVLFLAQGGNPDFSRLSALVQAGASAFWPQFKAAHASIETVRQPALSFIERLFLIDVIATVAIIAIAAAILQRQPLMLTTRRGATATAVAVNWMLLLLMIFNAAALPYVYGKVIQSTNFQHVEIAFDDPAGQDFKNFGAANLLASGDPFILYRQLDHNVWLVRAAKVKSLTIVGADDDVVQIHFFRQ